MNAIFSKVGDFLTGLSTMLLSLVTLSILAEVLFGVGVFGANVVKNVMVIIVKYAELKLIEMVQNMVQLKIDKM